MAENNHRRRSGDNGVLSDQTKVTLRFAVSVGFIVAFGFVGWHNLDKSIAQLRQDFEYQMTDLRSCMEREMGDRWSRTDDRVFMDQFSNSNDLRMPLHRPVTPVGSRM